jgi:hypothetical protein
MEALHSHGSRWAAVALVAAALAGCGPAREPKAARGEQLPEFTAEEASLFDDSFSPAVFSSEIAAELDDKLYLRVRRAETVVPAAIATVTEDRGSDGEHVFTLGLRPSGPPLAGAAWSEPVVVSVPPRSPSYPVLQGLGAQLVGTPVILFFRRYKGDGQVEVHWRAEPAREDVRQAVERARLLGELSQ